MAAILTSAQPVRNPHRIPAPQPRRPHLVVIEGGLSPRRMAAVHRRRRIVALLGLIIVLAVGGLALRAGIRAVTPHAPAAGPAAAATTGPSVVVQPGDTLWQIARRLQPSGDVRPLVDQLAAAHGPGALVAGEQIPVPS